MSGALPCSRRVVFPQTWSLWGSALRCTRACSGVIKKRVIRVSLYRLVLKAPPSGPPVETFLPGRQTSCFRALAAVLSSLSGFPGAGRLCLSEPVPLDACPSCSRPSVGACVPPPPPRAVTLRDLSVLRPAGLCCPGGEPIGNPRGEGAGAGGTVAWRWLWRGPKLSFSGQEAGSPPLGGQKEECGPSNCGTMSFEIVPGIGVPAVCCSSPARGCHRAHPRARSWGRGRKACLLSVSVEFDRQVSGVHRYFVSEDVEDVD